MLNIVSQPLEIGLSKPLRLMHVSDTHFTFADERDNERKRELAVRRTRDYAAPDCIANLDEAIDYARSKCDLLLHTGDLIDFVSYRNLDLVREKFRDVDYFFAAGNHEFSKYVGEAREDEAYKQQSLPVVQPAFRDNLRFASRLLGGVNLVAVDNSYYNFSREALVRFKAEIAKGYPVILMVHNPIYTPELFQEMIDIQKKDSSYLVGCPDGVTQNGKLGVIPDANTCEFIRYLKEQPLVKTVLAGHLHFNFDSPFSEYARQYVVGGTFHGCARELQIT